MSVHNWSIACKSKLQNISAQTDLYQQTAAYTVFCGSIYVNAHIKSLIEEHKRLVTWSVQAWRAILLPISHLCYKLSIAALDWVGFNIHAVKLGSWDKRIYFIIHTKSISKVFHAQNIGILSISLLYLVYWIFKKICDEISQQLNANRTEYQWYLYYIFRGIKLFVQSDILHYYIV